MQEFNKTLDATIKDIIDLQNYKANDWKKSYIGVDGSLYFVESLTQEGKYYAVFWPYKPNRKKGVKDYLRTSVGNVVINDKEKITLTTDNSVFQFVINEEDKKCLNTKLEKK